MVFGIQYHLLRIGSGASNDRWPAEPYWILLTEDLFLLSAAQLFPVLKQILEFEGVILAVDDDYLCCFVKRKHFVEGFFHPTVLRSTG